MVVSLIHTVHIIRFLDLLPPSLLYFRGIGTVSATISAASRNTVAYAKAILNPHTRSPPALRASPVGTRYTYLDAMQEQRLALTAPDHFYIPRFCPPWHQNT